MGAARSVRQFPRPGGAGDTVNFTLSAVPANRYTVTDVNSPQNDFSRFYLFNVTEWYSSQDDDYALGLIGSIVPEPASLALFTAGASLLIKPRRR